MTALIEALELDIMPPDAMPIPGVPGAYLHPVPNDLGMIEYHGTQTPKGATGVLPRTHRQPRRLPERLLIPPCEAVSPDSVGVAAMSSSARLGRKRQ
jgi:hypothetical protein